jgi:hypothetical protein
MKLSKAEFFSLMSMLLLFSAGQPKSIEDILIRELSGQVMTRMVKKLGSVKDKNKIRISLGEQIALYSMAVKLFEFDMFEDEFQMALASRIRLDYSPEKIIH